MIRGLGLWEKMGGLEAALRNGELGDDVGEVERNVEEENTFRDSRCKRGGFV